MIRMENEGPLIGIGYNTDVNKETYLLDCQTFLDFLEHKNSILQNHFKTHVLLKSNCDLKTLKVYT